MSPSSKSSYFKTINKNLATAGVLIIPLSYVNLYLNKKKKKASNISLNIIKIRLKC